MFHIYDKKFISVDDGGGAPTIKNRSDGHNLSAAVRQAQSSILMIKWCVLA